MSYLHRIRIDFSQCDPAGIVFFPRYVEMCNRVIENFFRDVVGLPYEMMLETNQGTPIARVEVDYRNPSRLGETLEWSLDVGRIGKTSATLVLVAREARSGEIRTEAQVTIVYIAAKLPLEPGKPLETSPWPARLQAAFADHLLEAA